MIFFFIFLIFLGISLYVTGKAKCKFDRRSDNDKREFTAKETYINYKLYLFGGEHTLKSNGIKLFSK